MESTIDMSYVWPSQIKNAKTSAERLALWNAYKARMKYSDGSPYLTLASYIDSAYPLSEDDIEQILENLFRGCRKTTKMRARLSLENNVGAQATRSCGMMQRIMKDRYGWSYCAGQDYDTEIAWVRKHIIGGFVE
jgi:hypothetical protein